MACIRSIQDDGIWIFDAFIMCAANAKALGDKGFHIARFAERLTDGFLLKNCT